MRVLFVLLLLSLLALPAGAQDEGTARLVTAVSGTTTYGNIMPGGRAGAHYTFADTDGVHQTRYFSVQAEQANTCIDSDIATTNSAVAVEIRRIVSAHTYAGSVNHLGAGNFLENDGCVALPGSNTRYYFYISTAPGAGITSDISVTGGTSSGTDHTSTQVITGLHSFTNAGITTFTGSVQAASFIADATPVPALLMDSTDSTGSDDGGVQLTECLAAQGCSLDLYVNSGADTKTNMVRIETSAANASTVQLGAGTPGSALTNYIQVDEGGAMTPRGTASISGFTSYQWSALDLASDGTECTQPAYYALSAGAPMTVVAIRCPHSTADTDGYVYGHMLLPADFDKDTLLYFDIYGRMYSDPGSLGTWYGAISVQCLATGELLTSWLEEAAMDNSFGNAVDPDEMTFWDETAIDVSSGGANCNALDVLIWRWKSCDDDATPSSNCTDNNGMESRIQIENVTMYYKGGFSGL